MSKDTEPGAAKTKGLHAGHRQRMWDRVLKDSRQSFEGFQDHELLEMLLYFVYSQKNTNPLAHSLINTCGSLGLVFNAPFTQLRNVEGCGPKSALLIKLCREISVRCQREDAERGSVKSFENTEDAIRYFRPRYIGKDNEVIMVAFLDNGRTVIHTVEFPPGQVNNSWMDVRGIIQRAMNLNAASIVICHNHPRGSARPSSSDFQATNELRDVLRTVRVFIFDHIIFGENGEVYSMVKDEQLPRHRFR